jgi:hypothetical protein
MNRLRAMLADAGECEEEEYDDEWVEQVF